MAPDPRPQQGALGELLDTPEEFQQLLSILALTDPNLEKRSEFHRIQLAVSQIALEDWYIGPHAGIVMQPFMRMAPSRFSLGTYGILYAADAFEVAVRESAYHAANYQSKRENANTPCNIPRLAFLMTLDESNHVDLRKHRPEIDHAIYDTFDYTVAQHLGKNLRDEGHSGIWYDSVRASEGTCYAVFRPRAVTSVQSTATAINLEWNGNEIDRWTPTQSVHL